MATLADGSPAMEFVVHKADLLRELSVTQGVVERKSTVPILNNFLLEATDNHNLRITGTDLELSLRTFCPAKVIKAGLCTVPARKLYDYVRLLQDGEITVKLLENHWVQIRSGRSNTKMVGMARGTFPTLPLFPSQASVQLPCNSASNNDCPDNLCHFARGIPLHAGGSPASHQT